jgi:UDP-glucose 4-epimerase
MKRILVTGAAGFVGKHTIDALIKKGYAVVGYDSVNGFNICDYKQLLQTIKKGDVVIHEAAMARFADCDKDPLQAYSINVQGTENVAKACEKKEASRLIYASTGSVYMPIEKEPPITEDFPVRGNSVYACSKCVAEKIVQSYDTPWIILRYAHLYGEGKIGHGAIGDFIARMNQGLAPIVNGGAQSNDFTFYKDIVQANLLALETEHLNEIFNIGTGEELTTIRVFEIMRKFFKYDKEFDIRPARIVDPPRFVYDISKAKRLLGYNPRFSFEEGLKDWLGEQR